MAAGFLEEDNGTKSSMRLMSFIALIAAITFGVITINRSGPNKDDTGIYITFGFLISAFAPKALQKFAEEKIPSYTRTSEIISSDRHLKSASESPEERLARLRMRGI